MTEATEALNRDYFADRDLHLSYPIEHGDTSAEERGGFDRVQVDGNPRGGFGIEVTVFGIL